MPPISVIQSTCAQGRIVIIGTGNSAIAFRIYTMVHLTFLLQSLLICYLTISSKSSLH